jgi:hypothetical protein
MTTVLARNVVIPFRGRRGPASDETKTFAMPRSPMRPQPAPAVTPSSPAPRAPLSVGPPARSPSARPRRRSTRAVVLALASLVALWSIFALGILVGRSVRSHVAHVVSAPLAAATSASPSPASDPVASLPSVEGEATAAKLDLPLITVGPMKDHAAARHAHGAKKSASHGVATVAAVSKRVATKKDDAHGAASPRPAAPGEAAGDAADDVDDDLGAASAADELARAQLDAVMP